MRTWIQSLASLNGLRIRGCHELRDAAQIPRCCGCGVPKPAAVAPIGPLAWEPPCAAGEALKKDKKKKIETTPLLTPKQLTRKGPVWEPQGHIPDPRKGFLEVYVC